MISLHEQRYSPIYHRLTSWHSQNEYRCCTECLICSLGVPVQFPYHLCHDISSINHGSLANEHRRILGRRFWKYTCVHQLWPPGYYKLTMRVKQPANDLLQSRWIIFLSTLQPGATVSKCLRVELIEYLHLFDWFLNTCSSFNSLKIPRKELCVLVLIPKYYKLTAR